MNGDDQRNGGVDGGSHRACADEIIYTSSSSKAPRPSRPKATRGSSNAESTERKGRRTKAAGSKNQKGKPKGEAAERERDKLDTKLDTRAEKSGEISFSARPAMAQLSPKGEAFL